MIKDCFPIWDEKYNKMGVTPRELYMRQNGLCWLVQRIDSSGEISIRCTDGKDEAETDRMLNPTHECIKCIAGFTKKVIKDAIKGSQSEK